MNKIYTYEDVYIALKNNDLELITTKSEYINTKEKVLVTDGIYKALITPHLYLHGNKHTPEWFNVKNPYIIYNINQFLINEKNGNFVCLSNPEDCKTRDSILEFKCNRCGTIIKKSLFNLRRKDNNDSHKGISCQNCDALLESVHAAVLKQLFLHYYPDTIVEDPSCINPNTNSVMRTDIVNHRLNIAIEVQGQWHKLPDQQQRDRIKKEFWINKGYQFYNYSIDNISVLDYVRLFFPNIEHLPEWVNMKYNNKLNLVKIQNMINEGLKVSEISDELNVNIHRIYDALNCGKLYYPDDYSKSNKRPIYKLNIDKKIINEYKSFSEAEHENNITHGLIASNIFKMNYFLSGYYWIPKDIYDDINLQQITSSKEKFYIPVDKYDMEDNYICAYKNMYEAAEDNDTIAYKIYEVTCGKRKSIKNYKYKIA